VTSIRQITANRLNARKSSGPRTQNGKLISRKNAFRHGLTAETVIDKVEVNEDYRVFEKTIVQEIAPVSCLESEFAARLASLLWRLRRATLIETGLLKIQYDLARENSNDIHSSAPPLATIEPCDTLSLVLRQSLSPEKSRPSGSAGTSTSANDRRRRRTQSACPHEPENMARAFLRVANLNHEILERMGRYEARIWRGALQTIRALISLRRQRHLLIASSDNPGRLDE